MDVKSPIAMGAFDPDEMREYIESTRIRRRQIEQMQHRLGYKHPTPQLPARRDVGRNKPCPCGSGMKYKKCCMSKVQSNV